MNPDKRREIFARLAAANPAPTTELEYRTPYELLVAVILSAQATDRSVNLATRELFKTVATPQQMVALGADGLIPYIKTIGLFRTKAKNVVEMSRQLLERHGGEVPSTRETLASLKTAAKDGDGRRAGERRRPYVKATSSAVNGAPSCQVRPCRRVNR